MFGDWDGVSPNLACPAALLQLLNLLPAHFLGIWVVEGLAIVADIVEPRVVQDQLSAILGILFLRRLCLLLAEKIAGDLLRGHDD